MPVAYIVLVVVVSGVLFGFWRAFIVVREDQRVVVFRLGRYLLTAGPGLHVVIPFVDRTVTVNLAEAVPGWQALPPAELGRRALQVALSKLPAASS